MVRRHHQAGVPVNAKQIKARIKKKPHATITPTDVETIKVCESLVKQGFLKREIDSSRTIRFVKA
jgi:hypothetical protein